MGARVASFPSFDSEGSLQTNTFSVFDLFPNPPFVTDNGEHQNLKKLAHGAAAQFRGHAINEMRCQRVDVS